MKITFTKMQALGNDFVVLDYRGRTFRKLTQLAKKLCDRRFGVGADQLLLLCKSKTADFKMRIFNSDGSEVEMCGNGIRCLGKYIFDDILKCGESSYAEKYCQSIDSLSIETLAGIMLVHKSGNLYRIDMGEPVFKPALIPVTEKTVKNKLKDGKIIEYPLKAGNKTHKATCISMGNPHAVIVNTNIDSIDIQKVGPLIENNKMFPNKTNVEFIQVLNMNNIKMRVWERGAGETLACGTGASASAVASALLGHTKRKATVHLPGGKLQIAWSKKDNHVYMTGPAVTVFEGEIEI